MATLKAVARKGRLALDEAKDLPEVTDIELVVVNDRNVDAELLQELEVSAAGEAPAHLVDFDAVFARL